MQRSQLSDSATVQENHERFLRRAVEHQSIWTVWGTSGPLIAKSTDDTGRDPPRDVYLFFSDEGYARRVLREAWPDFPAYSTRSISLFDFLYRWLPGLHRDGHLAGTNWTGGLVGLELEPGDLRAQLLDGLPQDLGAQLRQMLKSAK